MQNRSATAKIANISPFHNVSTCQNRWGKRNKLKHVCQGFDKVGQGGEASAPTYFPVPHVHWHCNNVC